MQLRKAKEICMRTAYDFTGIQGCNLNVPPAFFRIENGAETDTYPHIVRRGHQDDGAVEATERLGDKFCPQESRNREILQ